MRIALDCRSVFPGMGGIGRYTHDLATRLPNTGDGGFIYFVTERQQAQIHPKATQVTCQAGMVDPVFEQIQLPTLLRDNQVHLYHNTCFSLPVVKTCDKQVTTVHDVVFRTSPDLVEPRLRDYLDHWTEHALSVADAVITVSEYSKKAIIENYDVDPGHITTIYNGVSPKFRPASETEKARVRERYGLPDRFILYMGAIEPKKNLARLIQARRILGGDCPLVLAGPKARMGVDLPRLISEHGLDGQVRLLDYVPEELVVGLLSAATVFVYPSLYEGFGLPPLEAMACGTPAIVSDLTSLPEVVGDAALIANAFDAQDIARQIGRLLEEVDLRDEMIRRGKVRAAEFSWDLAATQTAQVYQKITKGGAA